MPIIILFSTVSYGQMSGDSLIKYSYTYIGIGGKGKLGAFGTSLFY